MTWHPRLNLSQCHIFDKDFILDCVYKSSLQYLVLKVHFKIFKYIFGDNVMSVTWSQKVKSVTNTFRHTCHQHRCGTILVFFVHLWVEKGWCGWHSKIFGDIECWWLALLSAIMNYWNLSPTLKIVDNSFCVKTVIFIDLTWDEILFVMDPRDNLF